MSTRSYIARQIGEDKFKTIYCHCDGYLSYNGAMLVDHYNTPEMVDKLIALGNISCLEEKLEPDPSKPHSFDYSQRQEGVIVAYGRDRNETNQEATDMSLKELDDSNNWTEYVYIFTQDNQWKYFKSGCSQNGFKDVNEELTKIYGRYGMQRPAGYYGFLTKEIGEELFRQIKLHIAIQDEIENFTNEMKGSDQVWETHSA